MESVAELAQVQFGQQNAVEAFPWPVIPQLQQHDPDINGNYQMEPAVELGQVQFGQQNAVEAFQVPWSIIPQLQQYDVGINGENYQMESVAELAQVQFGQQNAVEAFPWPVIPQLQQHDFGINGNYQMEQAVELAQLQPGQQNAVEAFHVPWPIIPQPQQHDVDINGGNYQEEQIPELAQVQLGQQNVVGAFQVPWPIIPQLQQYGININDENYEMEPVVGLGLQLGQQDAVVSDLVNHGDVAQAIMGEAPPQDFKCTNNCGGNLIGRHKCYRHGRSIIISCYCSKTFTAKNDFNRHCNTVHLDVAAGGRQLLDCTFPGCHRVGRKGFKRKDNLTQHRRYIHEEVIPKVKVRFGRGGIAGVEVEGVAAA